MKQILSQRLRKCLNAFNRNYSSTSGHSSRSKDLLGVAVFGGLSLGTLCLGIWQTRRYFWKVGLIEEAAKSLHLFPRSIDMGLSQNRLVEELRSRRGQRLIVKGVLDYSREMRLGLRGAPSGLLGPAAQGMASNPLGYYVITPLILPDGNIVFVNRGWVPSRMSEWMRPPGEVEIVTVVSEPEKRTTFSPKNVEDACSGTPLLWLEGEVLARVASGAAGRPVTIADVALLEIVDDDDAPLDRYPVARRARHFQQHFVGPEMHAAYAFTWFCLAAAGTFMTIRMFRRPRRKFVVPKT